MLFGSCLNILQYPYVANILKRELKVNVSTLPAYQPSGGEIYLYDTREYKRDWMADGYTWTNRGYCRSVKNKLRRGNFFINTRKQMSGKFRRFAYMADTGDRDYVLVHYVGDKNAYIPSAHGNSKKTDKPFERILPSQIEKAKKSLLSSSCRQVYEKMANEVDTSPIDDPNVKRLTLMKKHTISNLHKNAQIHHKMELEDMCEVHKMANTEEKFLRHIHIFPQFFCVAAIDEILQAINDVLTQVLDVPLLFFFDTTLVTNYKISILLCKHPAFVQNIPVVAALHRENLQTTFDVLLFHICQNIPNLKTNRCVFILNRDGSMNESLRQHCVGAHIVYCWDTLRNSFKATEKSDPYRHYKRDMNELLNSMSQWHFLQTYERLQVNWSCKKLKQFDATYKDSIMTFSGRWVIEGLGFSSKKEGVSRTSCFVWRRIFDQLSARDELKLTSLLGAFSEFQISVWNELNRGVVVDTDAVVQEVEMMEVNEVSNEDLEYE